MSKQVSPSEALENILRQDLISPKKYRKTIRDIASVGQVEIIEKSLKALEIINNKDVDIIWLKLSRNLIEYNFHFKDMEHLHYHLLTQEEFDLLKEVLK